jgi:LPXTG-site transpeptidase (sortase) family protein
MPPMALYRDTDPSQRAWYAPYLEVAFEQEIAVGYDDGTFRPANALTQREAVLMIVRSVDAQRGQHSAWKDDMSVAKRALAYGVRVAEPVILDRSVSYAEFLWMFPEERDQRPAVGGQSISQPKVQSPQISSTSSTSSSVVSQAFRQPEPEPDPVPDPVSPSVQYASTQPFAIAMPSLGVLDLTITHPSDPYTDEGLLSVLDRGVGHLFSYPGDGGVVFVYGHSSNWAWDRSGYAKIFRQINKLAVGDLVYVTYDGKLYVYQIMSKGSVPASDMAQFADNNDGEELLLYTCWPPDSISERYLVRAQPVQVITL